MPRVPRLPLPADPDQAATRRAFGGDRHRKLLAGAALLALALSAQDALVELHDTVTGGARRSAWSPSTIGQLRLRNDGGHTARLREAGRPTQRRTVDRCGVARLWPARIGRACETSTDGVFGVPQRGR